MNSAIIDKNEPFMPLVKITITPEYVSVQTNIRKLHTDGKWYIQEFWKKYSTEFIGLYDFQWIQNFYAEIYNNMILGEVSLTLRNAINGRQIYNLDENQEPETERLIKALNLGLNLKTKTEDENRQD